jgi:5-methylcytosine-specific restriction endonuclease McrA
MPEMIISIKQKAAFREYQIFYASGRCWVCGRIVGLEYLEIGHLIDKVCGGDSTWNNIRPMCLFCNHALKPLHDRLEDVYLWRQKVWHEARLQDKAIAEYEEECRKGHHPFIDWLRRNMKEYNSV